MSGRLDLESAAIRAAAIRDHVALIALAADGAIADGDDFNGRKFRAAADAVEDQLDELSRELDRLAELWRCERP